LAEKSVEQATEASRLDGVIKTYRGAVVNEDDALAHIGKSGGTIGRNLARFPSAVPSGTRHFPLV